MRTDAQFHAAIVRLTVAAEVVWILGAGLAVLLLTGCATGQKAEGRRQNEETNQMLLPPLPRAARSGAGSEVGHVARAIAPPVGPPAPAPVTWVNWPGARIAVIEKSPDMVTWTQIGRVTNQTHFLVSLDGPHGYFRVGHPAHETHHWFDPVLEIYKCDLPE
jgi:hypothetical protein